MESEFSPAPAGKSPKRNTKDKAMSPACEAHHLIAEIAGPMELGGRIKTALGVVARRTGLPERRVRGLWHKEARAIRADELDALRRAARQKDRAEHDAEMAELWAYVARLEERIAMVDETFAGGPREEIRRPVAPPGRLADGE